MQWTEYILGKLQIFQDVKSIYGFLQQLYFFDLSGRLCMQACR